MEFSTTVHDTHRNSFFLLNDHLNADEFKNPVPRIGKEPVFPPGPVSYCFCIPEACGLTFSPSVGTLKPGESQFITVMCNPTLSETDLSNMVRTLQAKLGKETNEGVDDLGKL